MPTASLERLIETEDLGLEIFHPGGVGISRELAQLAGITKGTRVLEVAAGSGRTARMLASEFGAQVTTVDRSAHMIAQQQAVLLSSPSFRVVRADARQLPFRAGLFDVVLSECALCQLDMSTAVGDWRRVLAAGGWVGIHDLCWAPETPERLKHRLEELEGERPKTVAGWAQLFSNLGFVEVHVLDRSSVLRTWTTDTRRALGLGGYLRTVRRVLERWGLHGLGRILASERLFSNPHLGYVIVLAQKPL